MLLEIRFEPTRLDGSKASKGSKMATFQCDYCSQTFEVRSHEKIKVRLKNLHQFCDGTCSMRYRWNDSEQRLKFEDAQARGFAVVRERHGHAMNAPGAVQKLSCSLRKTLRSQIDVNGMTNSQRTLFERHGVTCPYQLPDVKANAHTNEAQAKRLATMALNVSRTSRVEDSYYEVLKHRFGDEQVFRQIVDVENPKWVLDFYIASLHVYVQMDGVYWHGLDRSLEDIQKFANPRDKIIYRKWLTDREQDDVYKRRGLKLVRITDLQFKKGIILP